MTDHPTISCAKNGPLLVKGLERLVDLRDGKPVETGDTIALCRCGDSAKKPFCDGTHAKNGFTDESGEGRPADRREDHVGEQVTIHDNRRICAHAGFCTDRLPGVFRMGQEPWIDPDGASAEEVKEIVEACPSGALSYTVEGVEHRDHGAEPGVLIAPGGPYAVQGGVRLEDQSWAEGASQEHYDLCRCGQSSNKPFCDGSHWKSDFDEAAAS